MATDQMREHAGYLATKAQEALDNGKIEESQKLIIEAQEEMQKADEIDSTASQLKALKGDFNKPVNTVPVASTDVKEYNPNDTTSQACNRP